MSTAAVSSGNVSAALPVGAVLRRFAWKEYRMLRGLWLAVAVMGAIVQWLMNVVMQPQVDHPAALFAAALFSALLYAVGAAATTFSVEHEEGTYDFLLGLPTSWLPIFLGKLIIVILSAVALAVVLAVCGGLMGGFAARNGHDTALGGIGVAILEGIAWGTFFSLVLKRPLVAAILTLVVGGVAVHLAVNSTSTYPVASLVPQAYVEAVPLRLGIVTVVLAASVVVARRWLTVGEQPSFNVRSRISNIVGPLSALFGRVVKTADPRPKSGMMSRLIWQTWRESWKLLSLPLLVAFVLYVAVGLVLGLDQPSGNIAFLIAIGTTLFVPALYGAMVFGADQRRQSYRFLAEHAGRPRYVWFARHVVWLGALLVLTCVFALFVFGTATYALRVTARESLEQYLQNGYSFNWGFPEAAYSLDQGTSLAIRGAGLLAFGILAAYGIGQLCSMLVRSEIMAAFISLVLSSVLSCWVAILFAWGLSGWLFLLPLAIGLFLATWLRAPNWIAQRNGPRTWFKPLLAIGLPILFVGVLLPIVRLEQLPGYAEHLVAPVEFLSADRSSPEARETAQIYARAAELLKAGPKEDPLAKWRGPEYASLEFGEIDETKIPADQLEDFKAARKRETEAIRESLTTAINVAIVASKRPYCHFDFDLRLVATHQYGADDEKWGINSNPQYSRVNELLGVVAGETMTEPDDPFERYLAVLRMSRHLRSDQPSVVLIDQLQVEQRILDRIGNWATDKVRTKEQLSDALTKLQEFFVDQPRLEKAILADHLIVHAALTGKETPISLALTTQSSVAYLAYLANQLPWERQRALVALDRVTSLNIELANEFVGLVSSTTSRDAWNDNFRQWLRPKYPFYGRSLPGWEIASPAAATSYLMTMEYKARSPIHELLHAYCDTEVYRRAALVKIALAMYRLDHDEYPQQLADLSSYIDPVPLDPYAGQPFQYKVKGLDLPLRYHHYFFQDGQIMSAERIEANTPLFWSVGAGNALLQQNRYSSWESEGEDPDGPARQVTEVYYTFQSEDLSWWNDPVFAFPLPK